MSELINKSPVLMQRWHLLATVSVLSLLYCIEPGVVSAEEDRPTVWIELGAQFERAMTAQDVYSPPFFDVISNSGYQSPLLLENRLPWSFGGEGSLSIQPEGGDWVVTISARYGRASSSKRAQQQSWPGWPTWVPPSINGDPFAVRYENLRTDNSESHAIMDFQVGKDIGIGLLGGSGKGTVSIGIRYAQFRSKSSANMLTDPDHEVYKGKYLASLGGYFPMERYHAFVGYYDATRNFHGIGPSISVSGQTTLVGSKDGPELALDWGLNGALLFGRQRASVRSHTTVYSFREKYDISHGLPKYPHLDYQHAPPAASRSKSVVVPNIGGFAGVSMNWANAALKFGYRADFFFGAMDGGFDDHASKNRNFYGPFATISIGLGG